MNTITITVLALLLTMVLIGLLIMLLRKNEQNQSNDKKADTATYAHETIEIDTQLAYPIGSELKNLGDEVALLSRSLSTEFMSEVIGYASFYKDENGSIRVKANIYRPYDIKLPVGIVAQVENNQIKYVYLSKNEINEKSIKSC